jgi:hypothetical protein
VISGHSKPGFVFVLASFTIIALCPTAPLQTLPHGTLGPSTRAPNSPAALNSPIQNLAGGRATSRVGR